MTKRYLTVFHRKPQNRLGGRVTIARLLCVDESFSLQPVAHQGICIRGVWRLPCLCPDGQMADWPVPEAVYYAYLNCHDLPKLHVVIHGNNTQEITIEGASRASITPR